MSITQKVALKNVRFFSYHGFYPEEQILGNVFFIDVETSFQVEESGNDDILKTVNYELLFEIASDTPGFSIDESVSELGKNLKLPAQYESHRKQIEAALPSLA